MGAAWSNMGGGQTFEVQELEAGQNVEVQELEGGSLETVLADIQIQASKNAAAAVENPYLTKAQLASLAFE